MGSNVVISVLGGWLWSKLGESAKARDEGTNTRKALEQAIEVAYKRFAKKYANLAASLFDQTFLENHVGPELFKFLTRHNDPDVEAIAAAYRSQFLTKIPPGIEEAIADFLNFVTKAMKNQPELQKILDRRAIEKTGRLVSEVHTAITSPEADWQALEIAAIDAVARIQTDIANTVSLTLIEDKNKLDETFKKVRSAILIGPSGCGKSALAKRFATHSGRFYRFLWLTAEALNRPSLLEVGRSLGLNHSFESVFASAKEPRTLLVVDAIETLTNDGISNTAKVIRAAIETSGPGWFFLLIAQPEGWDQLAFQLRRAGVPLDTFSVVQTSGPSEKDVQHVLTSLPGLLPIAYQAALSNILTNLKLLDQVAIQAKLRSLDSEGIWAGVSEVVDWVWEGWIGKDQSRHARAEVIKYIAEREADAFGRGVATSQLSTEQNKILASLEDNEKLIEVRRERVYFHHDLTADWARYRLLAGERPIVPRLRELSSYPKWNAAIRLIAQHVLDKSDSAGSEWASLLSEVADKSPRGESARDLLLDAVILSTNAGTHLEKVWPILMEKDGKLLKRMLKRFLHVATVPDSRILLLSTEDEDIRHYLASNFRVPVFIHWWPLLGWLYRHVTDVINLAPTPLAKICIAWLRNTPVADKGQQPWPWRQQVAQMSLALVRELQAKEIEHSLGVVADKDAYEAAFLAASELPDEIGQWALEMANRRSLSPEILKRQQAYFQKEAERQKKLEADPKYQARKKELKGLISPIFSRGPLRETWPDGPTAMVHQTFRQVALDKYTLLPLMAVRPQIAQELILALIIEHPTHEEIGRSILSSQWCGLQSLHDGTPAMYDRGPFLIFLYTNTKIALDTIIRLVNFATDRFCERMFVSDEVQACRMRIPLTSGEANWHGDNRVYGFSRSETFNTALLSSALMAVEKWLYDKIEQGQEVDKWIEQIIRESRSVAFAGLLLTVGKKEPALLERVLLPLLGAWQFYSWDQQLTTGGDPWQISMMSWSRHGEKMYNQVVEWHTLEHRKTEFLGEVLKLFHTREPVRNFFADMYKKWTEDKETHETTKHLAERFNPSNYSLMDGANGKSIEIHFQWPEHMRGETTESVKKSGNVMLLLSFPIRCRQILDEEESLPFDQLEEFWTQIQSISGMDEQDIEFERPSQRIDAICGGIAVLFIKHRSWLAEAPEKEEWCIKNIIETISAPPQPSQFDVESSVGTWTWDSFIGETGVLLLSEDPADDVARAVTAHGVMAYHEVATDKTLTRAFILREKLGEEFIRLHNLGLLWATLRHLRPQEHCLTGMKKWGAWADNLFRCFVDGRVPSIPLPIRRVALGGYRLYAQRWYKEQHRRYPEYIPESLHWNFGMYAPLLQQSLLWLRQVEPKDPHLPTGFADDICVALLEFSLSTAGPEGDEGDRQSCIPTKFDQWVFEILSGFIPKKSTPDKSSKFWKPLFDAGPLVHHWPKFFLMAWFTTGLRSADSLETFARHWAAMISYALEHSKWKPDKSRSYWDIEEVYCHLMGMDFATRIVGEGEFDTVLESFLPYYDDWRRRWLSGHRSLKNFCRLLTYPSAISLRIPAVFWVRSVLTEKAYFSSRESDVEDAIFGLLRVVWSEHRKNVQNDSSLKEAFLDILTWLVQRQNPAALELQDDVVRSR